MLSKDTNTSRDLALYTLFSDEIAPQIRFAAHSLGHKAAYDIDAIVKEVVTPKLRDQYVPGLEGLISKLKDERAKEAGSSSGSNRAMLREPMWEGLPVPIRNPELVDVFLKVQNAEDAMKEGKTVKSGKTTAGGGAQSRTADGKENTGSAPTQTSTRGKVAAYDDVLLALTEAEAVAQKLVESKEVGTSCLRNNSLLLRC